MNVLVALILVALLYLSYDIFNNVFFSKFIIKIMRRSADVRVSCILENAKVIVMFVKITYAFLSILSSGF